MKGLNFNPYTAFETVDDYDNPIGAESSIYENDNSVPTVAGQYYSPTPQQPSIPEDQNIEEDDDTPFKFNPNIDYKKDVDKYIGGLKGLDWEERNDWENENSEKIAGQDEDYIERLWKNQQFAKAFGTDWFYKIPDAETRDKIYEDYYTNLAVEQKFGNNFNKDKIDSLTNEGKRELLNSEYKSDSQLAEEHEALKDKSFWEMSGQEKADVLAAGVKTGGSTGTFAGSIIGGAWNGGAGVLPGMVIGGMIGLLGGAAATVIDPSKEVDAATAQKKIRNQYILDKIVSEDEERKKLSVKEDADDMYEELLDKYNNGEISKQEIDERFDKIALSSEDNIGSNYYSAFKDTDDLKSLSTTNKLKHIAQTDAIAMKYGKSDAAAVLDHDMQNYVNESQNAWDWYLNTQKNILVGGIANLWNNVIGLEALATYLAYGDEGLANFLQGKDASGNGEKNSIWKDPQYWNKVDQYNTLDPDYINEVDKTGGVSRYNNVVRTGEEGDFLSWNTLNEAAKMSKFAWSDLIKNLSLAKLVQLGALKAGGKFLPSGALATESTTASQVINKLGSAGIVGGSSIGIDVAYGIQTFNEVLEENNAKLDRLIDKEVSDELEKRMADPETMQQFKAGIDAENARRQASVREGEPWAPVDEEEAYKELYTSMRDQIAQEYEARHAEDREQAAKDAADAYVIDATTEAIRMATTNAMFKNYLFDKGTLRALRSNNPLVDVVSTEGKQSLGRWATQKEAAKVLSGNIWGGFQSNYFDDVTVAMAKGFELQDYNNYLMQKYNPAAYGSVLDNYVDPMIASMVGVTESFTDSRSWLDGTVGALGAPLSIAPNIAGMVKRGERMKQAAEAKARDEKMGIKTLDYGVPEMISDFVNTPILEAMVEARERTRTTQREIERANKSMQKNGYMMDNMVSKIAAIDKLHGARRGESLLDAEDAKDNELFELASELVDMKNNYAIATAQAEPSKADWSNRKKVSAAIREGMNYIIEATTGIDMKQYATTPYSIAMQQLEDAAAITEGAADEAQAERQQKLIDTFLALEDNQEIAKDSSLSENEKRGIAAERLQKNATEVLDAMQKIDKIKRNLENSIDRYGPVTPNTRDQLLFQYVMADRWKKRGEEIDKTINPEGTKTTDTTRTAVAKYGSYKGFTKALESQKEKVEAAKKEAEAHKAQLKEFKKDPELSDLQNTAMWSVFEIQAQTAEENYNLAKQQLALMEDEGRAFESQKDGKTTTVEHPIVLTSEEILGLDPESRLRMLDPYHKNDYSSLQQREIEAAWNKLTADGRTRDSVLNDLKDSATLKTRIDDNNRVADRIMKNPSAMRILQNALVANRQQAIWDYFNDKVSNEALNELLEIDHGASESNASDKETADKMLEAARNMSYAKLKGIKDLIKKEKGKAKRSNADFTDKFFNNITTAIDKVLQEREERKKDTSSMLDYVNKMDNLTVTEVNDDVQTTKEVPISENDKGLLKQIANFAAEKNISLEEAVSDRHINDLRSYIEESNHRETPENWVTMQSPEYMTGLIDSAKSDYAKYKETHKEEDKPKPVSNNPKSVDTAEENRDSKDNNENPAPRPTERRKTFAEQFKENQNRKELSSEDSSIIELAARDDFYKNIEDEIRGLIDFVNNDMQFADEDTKNKIKEAVRSIITEGTIKNAKNFKTFMETLYEKLKNNGLISHATVLRNSRIMPLENQARTDTDDSSITDGLKGNPRELTTLDLDSIMDENNPRYKVLREYAKQFGILDTLNALVNLLNNGKRNDQNNNILAQFPVRFLYDEDLASKVMDSMGRDAYVHEYDAPVVMAISLDESKKDHQRFIKERFGKDSNLEALAKDNNSGIVTVKINKSTFYLMPIGFMPASNNTNPNNIDTASKMTEVRKGIKLNKKGVQIINIPNTRSKKLDANIVDVDVTTGIENGVHTTDEYRSISLLFDENVNNESERLVNASDEELREYNEAEGPVEKRDTNLYERIRSEFIRRLSTEKKKDERTGQSRTFLKFKVKKGTRGFFTRALHEKAISETLDKNSKEGVRIIDLLKALKDPNNKAVDKTVANIKMSNSRFTRLFNKLMGNKSLKVEFDDAGNVVGSANEIAGNIADTVETIVKNYLNITNSPSFSTRFEDSKAIISVKTGENTISELQIQKDGIKEADIARFIADLILDKEGQVRLNRDDKAYELVKWQVTYTDVERALHGNGDEKANAIKNLEELFDDNIFTFDLNKLAYPASTVVARMTDTMLEMYGKAEKDNLNPTDKKSGAPVTAKKGEKLDPDTGAKLDKDSSKPGKDAPTEAQQKVLDALKKIIDETNQYEEPDKDNYNIKGSLWHRITKIKHVITGSKSKKVNESSWLLPGSLAGNSFDEFSRDFFNKLFDKLGLDTKKKRMEFFENYANSTAQNYEQVHTSLLKFAAKKIADGEKFVVTGRNVGKTGYDRGKLVVTGELNASAIQNDGRKIVGKSKVAGTIDLSSVNEDGNIILYDFKTHHSDSFTVDDAIDKGYNVQMSLYALFLEKIFEKLFEEEGIANAKGEPVKVVGIRIIPARTYYDRPIGINSDGTAISNGKKYYKEQKGTSQMLEADQKNPDKFTEFHGANYVVEEDFEMPRLIGDDLNMALEKMSDEEKSNLYESFVEQAEENNEEAPQNQDTAEFTVEKADTDAKIDDEEEDDLTDGNANQNIIDNYFSTEDSDKDSTTSTTVTEVTDAKASTEIKEEGSPEQKKDDHINKCKQ